MSSAIWRFELLGRLRAQREAQVPAHISVRRIGVLLASLVMRGPAPVPRDELISLLWPDDPIDAARNRLRVLLNNLKHHLEHPEARGTVIIANRTTVGLIPGSYTTDYHEFHTLIADAATQEDDEAISSLEAASALYRGELLDGLSDEWIVTERRRLSEVRYQVIRDLIERLRAQGALDRAADYARQAVVAEPLDEEAHADLIELYGSLGRPSAGLRQYDQLKRLLNTELNARPSANTREIAARLTEQLGHGVGEMKRAVRPVPLLSQPRIPVPGVVDPERAALPMRLTKFFGRQDELHTLSALLDIDSPTRLITIIGPGGTGKTRVALQAAEQMANPYCGRVYFAELAEIKEPDQAAAAMERAIGLPPSSDADSLSRIVGVLEHAPALLILDNLEQLVPDISIAISNLLSEAPTLRILATSRRSLGVEGEQEFSLGPLPAPAPGADINTIKNYPGVALFLDRAVAVRPNFAESARAIRDAADICNVLEGMPLAIELAAARARSMTSSEIKRQTAGVLTLLVDVRGTRQPRHRSLRSTIEWSYRLLTSEEQQVFISLVAFAGGFTAKAAAYMASVFGIEVDRTGELLDQLCSASMISLQARNPADGFSDTSVEFAARFVMLDTIRQFGLERLTELPDHVKVLERHFWYFSRTFWGLDLGPDAETEETQIDDPDIAADEANLRMALDFGMNAVSDSNVQQAAISLLCRLCNFWESHGMWSKGTGYLVRALSLPESAFSDDTRLSVTLSAARQTCMVGQYDCAVAYAEDGLKRAEAIGDHASMSEAHTWLGTAAFFRADYLSAEQCHTQALSIRLELNDRKGVAASTSSLANVAFYLGRDHEAIKRFQEALAIYRELADGFGAASVLQKLGNALRQQGNLLQGMRDISEALETFRKWGYRQGVATCLHDLGLLLFFRSDYAAAYERYMESLDLFREIGYRRGEAVCLFNLGTYHTRMGSGSDAQSYLQKAVELSIRIGDRRNLASCLGALGFLARCDGRYTESRAEYMRSLEIELEIGSRGGVSNCLTGLGCVALDTGKYEEASDKLSESLSICVEMGIPGAIAGLLELHGDLRYYTGHPAVALQLYASAERIRVEIGVLRGLPFPEHADDVLEAIRASIGDEAFARAWRVGEKLTTNEAVALVLSTNTKSPQK